MIFQSASRRRDRRNWLLAKSFWLFGGAVLAAPGCEAPVPNVLTDGSGNQIRRSTIDAILADPDLDEAEQRQALRDLGITDEQLIDALVAGG